MSRYQDMPVCDLRYLSDVEAIRQIEEISDVATLVLPKDASSEVQSALAAIPKSDIAATLYLNKEDTVHVINGFSILSDNDFAKDGHTVILVNGCACVRDLSEDMRGALVVNGAVVLQESVKKSQLSFPLQNGMKLYMDFDDCKVFQNQLELDAAFLSYLPPKTLLFVGNELRIATDVTVEALQKAQVRLVVGNVLLCPEPIISYIKATAFVGNMITAIENGNDEG